MNWDQLEGKWQQVKGSVKERWGKLTDDDLHAIGGKKDQLVGKIQERYGIAKEDAEREADAWRTARIEQQAREDQKERDLRRAS